MRNELINARETLRFTQAMVAEAVNISRSFYGLIETGNRNPSYGLALKIATKVNKNVNDIFFDLDGFRMKRKLPANPPNMCQTG